MANNTPAKGKAAAAPSDGWVFRVGGRTCTDEAGAKRLARGDTGVPASELGLIEFDEGAVTGPGAWPAFTWASLIANDAVVPIAPPALEAPVDPVPPIDPPAPAHDDTDAEA